MRDKSDFEDEEVMSKRQVAGTMMEAVENQLEGYDPVLSPTFLLNTKKMLPTTSYSCSLNYA